MTWQSFPYKIDAQAGQTLYFCSCGQTNNPPYCDGSHEGSGKAPRSVKIEKDGPVWACGCGKSKNLPTRILLDWFKAWKPKLGRAGCP